MLSAGKPSVLSPLCLKGIPELEHGVNCLVGEDRESFRREVVRLLGDSDLRDRIARNGRELIAQRYSWEVIGPRVWKILESVMEDASRGRRYLL
jgi:glycosyltransferase involved in cell wall biosynthesis